MGTKRKLDLLAYFGLCLLVLAGCTGNVAPDDAPTPLPAQHSPTLATPTLSKAQRPATAIVPRTLPGEDQIAIYPGATDIEKDDENAPLSRSVLFTTRDTMDQVYDFYKKTYISQGWQVNDKRITFMDADFIWADDAGVVPWHEGLGLDVYDKVEGGIRYVIWTSRRADPDNIPVIEGAEDVKVSMISGDLEGLETLRLGPARVVTYTTSVSATAVLGSYKYHMESYGWRNRGEGSGEVSFGYNYGVPERMYINIAIIRAEAKEGKTTVTVAASGADVHNAIEAYTPPIATVAHTLPEPPQLPVYPDAHSTAVHDERGWQSRLYVKMEEWTTLATPDQIKQFYVDALTKQGWKQVDHPRVNWYRFTYDIGPSCQSRRSVYLVIKPPLQGDKITTMVVITGEGCYVISGDE